MKIIVHYKAGVYLSITETWIYGQIKNLKRYKPIVYATSTQNLDIYPTENIRSLDLKIGLGNVKTFFNKAWNKVFHFYPSFVFSLLKDRPHLVHVHYGNESYGFLPLKRLFRLPVITTFYGYDVNYLPQQDVRWRKRYKELFSHGECFLVEGSHMKEALIKLGCHEEKIIVQHLGIDLNDIKFMPRKLSEGEEIRILISGSFREKKGIPYGVEAFGRVKETYPNLKLKLTIIGDSGGSQREEQEKKRILNTIQNYNLKDCVNMLGYQPYPVFLRELYRNHIFVQPSVHASDGDTEGGAPVSIIEASASGMPILATRHCDIPEVVIDGESGYLVAERDVDALAERLTYLVSHPKEWKEIGEKGRKHIKTNYDVKKQVQKLEEIYDQVLENER